MKIRTFFLVLFIGSATIWAQEWQTDFNYAKELAKSGDKPIILVFQGSDWCAPCIKLEQQIWSSEEFKNYSSDHFVLLLADFPRKKQNKLSVEQQEKNKDLAETYNQNGYFPLVVVLDKDGRVLGQTGYKKITVKEYIGLLESFKE
ncbi:thioredoxin family protein [uncultured Eudoraea sp.]|uniref:thioredoxin family protein n=1 Tax=uncultured Eudoraea sp. TaxID=1035614 RepID=UPI0026162DD0|nr:thioredoxin family protein [uncultured Eudoraea sp.]